MLDFTIAANCRGVIIVNALNKFSSQQVAPHCLHNKTLQEFQAARLNTFVNLTAF